jgi:hypothetical protein
MCQWANMLIERQKAERLIQSSIEPEAPATGNRNCKL